MTPRIVAALSFEKTPDRGDSCQAGEPCPPPAALAFGALQVDQKAAQQSHAGQQVRPPDHVCYRFRERRVHRPQRRDPDAGPPVANETPRQGIYQQHVSRVQEKVDAVIARGMVGVTQERIVEQIGKCGEWTIQAAFTIRPPIGVLQDQLEVFGSSLVNSRVLKEKPAIVQHETGAERIGVGQQGDRAQRHYGKHPLPAERRAEGPAAGERASWSLS